MNNFNSLVSMIQNLHRQLQRSAANTVNQMLTIRNWLIGYYIIEFEQNGKDRAEYGKSLLKSIAGKLKHIKGLDERSLRRFRQFYLFYPQIADTIRGSVNPIFEQIEIWGSLTPILPNSEKVGALIPPLKSELYVSGEKILKKLSYTHIEQLIGIDESLKRTFYEIESMKGAWSLRELKRQISSLYFERSGLSKNPEKLAKLVRQKTKPQETTDIIKKILEPLPTLKHKNCKFVA